MYNVFQNSFSLTSQPHAFSSFSSLTMRLFAIRNLFLIVFAFSFFTSTLGQQLSLRDGYAACKSDPVLTNSPYCPQLANNILSPTNGQTYTIGSYMTCSWNSRWNTFATTGTVDVYLCPNSTPETCVSISKNVPAAAEQLSFYLAPNLVSDGPYFYLVVASGGSVSVPFSDRGASVTLVSPSKPASAASSKVTDVPPSTPNSASFSSNSTSPRSPQNATATDSSPSSSTSTASLSPLAIALISVGSVLLLSLILLLAFLFLRRKKNSDLPLPRLPPPPSSPKPASFSTSEAILLANSFKLALRSPFSNPKEEEEEDLEKTINSLGMRSLPRNIPSSAGQGFSVEPIQSQSTGPKLVREVRRGTNYNLENIVSA